MDSSLTYHSTEYAKRKPLPKKDVLKLKPGTWIRVKWRNIPDRAELLLQKVEDKPGVQNLITLHDDGNGKYIMSAQTGSDQVMENLGPLLEPAVVLGTK